MLSVEKLTAQTYFKKKKIQNLDLEWKDITLPRRVTINTNLRIFQ